jgi:hypothetical protein
MASRSNIPSVMYLSIVWGPVMSSNRIEYPTCSPSLTSISSATRCATLIAATRRGCVHATSRPFRAATHHCGIWNSEQCITVRARSAASQRKAQH